MSAKIYIEGGGDSDELQRRCRKAFRKLLESCGFQDRMPRIVACGGRGQAFDAFKTAHLHAEAGMFIALLVDSEDPVKDIEKPWEHLHERDGWDRPADAVDDQVLLMVTCMESWIAADRPTLKKHYGAKLKVAALPSLVELEHRNRNTVYGALCKATSDCSNAYQKGKRSFDVFGELMPAELRKHVKTSFERFERVLNKKL